MKHLYPIIFSFAFSAQAADLNDLKKAVEGITPQQIQQHFDEVTSQEDLQLTSKYEQFQYYFCSEKTPEVASCSRIIQFHGSSKTEGEVSIVLHYRSFVNHENEIEVTPEVSFQNQNVVDEANIEFIKPVLKELEKDYNGYQDILQSSPAFHPFSTTIVLLDQKGDRVGMGTDEDRWVTESKYLISFSENVYSQVTSSTWSYSYVLDLVEDGDTLKIVSIKRQKF